MKPTSYVEPGLQPLVDLAVSDLANRLSVDPAAIAVVRAEAVVWPDGSLGCPEPGMGYIQVLTDGYRIVLTVGATRYSYHGSGTRGPFYCENPAQ